MKRVENSNVWIYTDYKLIMYMYVSLLIGYTCTIIFCKCSITKYINRTIFAVY